MKYLIAKFIIKKLKRKNVIHFIFTFISACDKFNVNISSQRANITLCILVHSHSKKFCADRDVACVLCLCGLASRLHT